MFTLEQIKQAHGKVKSGADFPAYIQDLKKLGVTHYQTFVSDGHTDYYGQNEFKVTAPAGYQALVIADTYHADAFTTELKDHQQGKTNYTEFIAMCAQYGVEKWEVRLEKMTCTYFDTAGNEVLAEKTRVDCNFVIGLAPRAGCALQFLARASLRDFHCHPWRGLG